MPTSNRTSLDIPGIFAQRAVDTLGARAVLLYGSHARGEARPYSDHDVAVVADVFDGVSRRDRIGRLLELAAELYRIEPMGYAPVEFESLAHSLVWDILEEGRVLVGTAYVDPVLQKFRRLRAAGAIVRIHDGWRYDRQAILAASPGDLPGHLPGNGLCT